MEIECKCERFIKRKYLGESGKLLVVFLFSHLCTRGREAGSKSGGFPVLKDEQTAVDFPWTFNWNQSINQMELSGINQG